MICKYSDERYLTWHFMEKCVQFPKSRRRGPAVTVVKDGDPPPGPICGYCLALEEAEKQQERYLERIAHESDREE